MRRNDCLHFISRTLLSLHTKSFCSPRHRRIVCKTLTYAVPFWMPRSSSTTVANGRRNCAMTHSNNGNEFSSEHCGAICLQSGCTQCDTIDVIVYRSDANAYIRNQRFNSFSILPISMLFSCSSLANILHTCSNTNTNSIASSQSFMLSANCLFIFAKIKTQTQICELWVCACCWASLVFLFMSWNLEYRDRLKGNLINFVIDPDMHMKMSSISKYHAIPHTSTRKIKQRTVDPPRHPVIIFLSDFN